MKKMNLIITVMTALILLISACSPQATPATGMTGNVTPDTSLTGNATPDTSLTANATTDTSTTTNATPDTSMTANPTTDTGTTANATPNSGTTANTTPDTGTTANATPNSGTTANTTPDTGMPAAGTQDTTMTAVIPNTGGGPANIMIGKNDKLGSFLQDDKGMTLYVYTKDTPNTSTCYDKCAVSWIPLLTNGNPVAATGIDASKLGTIKRTDGSMQVTYFGMPLYYFAKDLKPGDAYGQNMTSLWFVISPAGDKIIK